jgi:hypothetical protein
MKRAVPARRAFNRDRAVNKASERAGAHAGVKLSWPR